MATLKKSDIASVRSSGWNDGLFGKTNPGIFASANPKLLAEYMEANKNGLEERKRMESGSV